MTQTTVDRARSGAARGAHIQLADQASQAFRQIIADVGDVRATRTLSGNALAAHVETDARHGSSESLALADRLSLESPVQDDERICLVRRRSPPGEMLSEYIGQRDLG